MLWTALAPAVDEGGVAGSERRPVPWRVRIEVYAFAHERLATAHDVVVGSEVRVAPLLEWEPRRE